MVSRSRVEVYQDKSVFNRLRNQPCKYTKYSKNTKRLIAHGFPKHFSLFQGENTKISNVVMDTLHTVCMVFFLRLPEEKGKQNGKANLRNPKYK